MFTNWNRAEEFDKQKLRSVLTELMLKRNDLTNRIFYEKEINAILNLPANPLYLPHKDQFAGNCPWASAKLMFRAVMYAHIAKTDPVNAEHYSREMYKAWTSADRKAALNDFLADLQKLPNGISPTPMSKEETLKFILKRSANYPEVSDKIIQELHLPLSIQKHIKSLQQLDKAGFKIAFSQDDLDRELRSNPMGTPILDANLVIWRKTKTGSFMKTNISEGETPGKFIIDDYYLSELSAVELKDQLDIESREARMELQKLGCQAGWSLEDAHKLYWDQPPLTPILYPDNWLVIRKPDQAKSISLHFTYDMNSKKFNIVGKEKKFPPMTAKRN